MKVFVRISSRLVASLRESIVMWGEVALAEIDGNQGKLVLFHRQTIVQC
jgi:hypothetical protein